MEKELPIIIPIIETYQYSSFVLGIVMAHENFINWYYNGYINMICKDTDLLENLALHFTNDSWEDLRLAGLAEMELLYLNDIPRREFVVILRNFINNGKYILLYKIDDYYLSYSDFYHKNHYVHDTYLYGYNERGFMAMAYTKSKLSRLIIPFEEIEEAMYSAMDIVGELDFCTFALKMTALVNFEESKLLNGLKDYLNSVHDNQERGYIYGVQVYDRLIDCLLKFGESGGKKKLDLRPFRMIWEHKKVLRNHLNRIGGESILGENCYVLLNELESTADKVFRLAIKYNVTYRIDLLTRIKKCLSEIRDRDIKLISGLCRILGKMTY